MIQTNPVRNVTGIVTDNYLVIDPIVVKGCPIVEDSYTVEDGLNEIARYSGIKFHVTIETYSKAPRCSSCFNFRISNCRFVKGYFFSSFNLSLSFNIHALTALILRSIDVIASVSLNALSG